MHKTNNAKINKYFKELFTVPTTQMKLFSQRTYKDEKDKRVCIPNLSSIAIKEKKKKQTSTHNFQREWVLCAQYRRFVLFLIRVVMSIFKERKIITKCFMKEVVHELSLKEK